MAANKAQLDFAKPTNGLISKIGFALVKSGFDIKDWGSIGQTPAGVNDNQLFFEKNSGAILLQPDLELAFTSMSGGFGYMSDSVGDATEKITFSTSVPVGIDPIWKPAVTLLHQSAISGSINATTAALEENQGMMVWWDNWKNLGDVDTDATDTDVAMIVQFNQAGTIGSDIIKMKIFFNKTVHIERTWSIPIADTQPVQYTTETQEWDVDFSKGYDNDADFNTLTFMFIDKYMIIGFNGLNNYVALKCRKFDIGTDLNSKSYPILSRDDSTFTLIRAGALLFGMKKITYKATGSYVSDWLKPTYDIDSISTIEATMTKGVKPLDTDILGPFQNDMVVALETTGAYLNDILTGRIRWGIKLKTVDTAKTPLFYSWMIQDPVVRDDATSDSFQITSAIESYVENCYANKDGSFGDRTGSMTLNSIVSGFQTNVFNARNYQIDCKFQLRDAGAFTTRARLFQDVHEVSNPTKDTFTLSVEALGIIKRLKKTPVLNSVAFDHLGWKGTDLIKYLIEDLGGVTLTIDATLAQLNDLVALPVSEDRSKPNWQFSPGVSLWDAANTVRAWMGWALYPTLTGGSVTLKPMPTSSSSADYTIVVEDETNNIRYIVSDIAKTRFLIIGKSGKNVEGQYKVGDKIMAYKTNATLENTIGETRPLWLCDPALSSIEMCEAITNQLYDWYTAIHTTVSFIIDDARSYFEGGFGVYDVLALSDTRVPAIDGKYVVLGYTFDVTPFDCKLTVEAISL